MEHGQTGSSRLEKLKGRESYRNVWDSPILETATRDLPYFCLALWCAPCVSYHLRRRALYNDMTKYQCCGGYFPCSGNCGESHSPEACLCAEVTCCFPTSVVATRSILQDEFNIQNTKCDNCLIAAMFFAQQAACMLGCLARITGSGQIAQLAQYAYCIAEGLYVGVCTCMQTQHKIQLDKRDEYINPMQAPSTQQMS